MTDTARFRLKWRKTWLYTDNDLPAQDVEFAMRCFWSQEHSLSPPPELVGFGRKLQDRFTRLNPDVGHSFGLRARSENSAGWLAGSFPRLRPR